MRRLTRLMMPAYARLPLPVFFFRDAAPSPQLNPSAAEFCGADRPYVSIDRVFGPERAEEIRNRISGRIPNCPAMGTPGDVVVYDDSAAVFLPAAHPGAERLLRVLDWLRHHCAPVLGDEPLLTAAIQTMGRAEFDLSRMSRELSLLLKPVAQASSFFQVAGIKYDPFQSHCDLLPLFDQLCGEANYVFRSSPAEIRFHIPQIRSVAHCSRDCISAAFHSFLTAGLTLSQDMRADFTLRDGPFGLLFAMNFRTQQTDSGYEQLSGIPQPGGHDLTYAIIREVIDVVGGELRFANTDGSGEFVLLLTPGIHFNSDSFLLNAFSQVELPMATPASLEYAEIYHRKI